MDLKGFNKMNNEEHVDLDDMDTYHLERIADSMETIAECLQEICECISVQNGKALFLVNDPTAIH